MDRRFSFSVLVRQTLLWCGAAVVAGGFFASPARSADKSAEPVVTLILPTLDEADQELKMLFDLAGDAKGYKELKETLDTFVVGVDRDRMTVIRLYATPEGIEPVVMVPIKSPEQFREFSGNLFDLDVKSFPPPMPGLISQVPREKQAAAKEAKLQKNERLIFGLYDAYMKYDAGYARIGEHLSYLRSLPTKVEANRPQGARLFAEVNGEHVSADVRRAAFEKTQERILKELKAEKGESEAAFNLRKAITEQQLHDLGRLFVDTSRSTLAWNTDLQKKRTEVHGTLSPQKDSSLAATIQAVGKSPTPFAEVPSDDCVFALTLNLQADEAQQKMLQDVVQKGRVVVRNRIEESRNRDTGAAAIDTDLADLVFDIVEDGFRQTQLTSFVRTWAEADEKLTTVGGAKVQDGAKFVELLQKIGSRHQGTVQFKIETVAGTDIHQITVKEDARTYPEFLDASGSVYVGTAEDVVWYAIGENSLERLKLVIQATAKSQGKSGVAMSLQARMHPLVKTWNDIANRRRATQSKAKTGDSKSEKALQTLRDLELDSVALHAFSQGKDTLSATLESEGENLKLRAEFDEGILRFVGESLSKFVKDNLAD